MPPAEIVFLFDVDNTLLDNDRVTADLKRHLESAVGPESRILNAVKDIWKSRVTTVFVRQGHYAHDSQAVAKYPPADVSIQRIGDLAELIFRGQTKINRTS